MSDLFEKDNNQMDTVAVLIPCYNESMTIGKILNNSFLLMEKYMYMTIILLIIQHK